jgi:glycosyltransferase involved in cell wall biosynthesis
MKVSVLVMTYNHAQFIRHALDTVLMQDCDFDYEVVISEDFSTDGTRAIVEEYQRQHPGKVSLLLSTHNLRSNAIVVRGIRACKGQFIALLDGDDYWITSDKLRKQVMFLESHPGCAICFHNAKVIDGGAERSNPNWNADNHPEITSLKDLWFGNFIATSSTMFRRGLINEFPAWYDDYFPITDWPLHILNAEQGDIGYINEVMSVYRFHKAGYYSQLTPREKQAQTLKLLHRMNKDFKYQYNRLVKIAISKYFIEWAEEYLKRGEIRTAKACYKTCLTGRPVNEYVSLKHLVRLGRQLYLPSRAGGG